MLAYKVAPLLALASVSDAVAASVVSELAAAISSAAVVAAAPVLGGDLSDESSTKRPPRCKGYRSWCPRFEIRMSGDQPILHTTCFNIGGQRKDYTMNLNDCLANIDGELRTGAHFSTRCSNMNGPFQYVCAECDARDGKRGISCIDTDTFMCSDGDYLQCQ